jgi:5-keto 4-deoxyuronate isomerase
LKQAGEKGLLLLICAIIKTCQLQAGLCLLKRANFGDDTPQLHVNNRHVEEKAV